MPEETNPRLLRTIRQDMGRVGTEVRRTGLKGTVGRALEDLREFYLTTEDLRGSREWAGPGAPSTSRGGC